MCGLSLIHAIVSLTDSMQVWSPKIRNKKALSSTLNECRFKLSFSYVFMCLSWPFCTWMDLKNASNPSFSTNIAERSKVFRVVRENFSDIKKTSDVWMRRVWVHEWDVAGRGRVGCPEHSFEELHPILQTLPSVGSEKITDVISPELPLQVWVLPKMCFRSNGVHGSWMLGWPPGGMLAACSSHLLEDLQTANMKCPAPGGFHTPLADVAYTNTFVGG